MSLVDKYCLSMVETLMKFSVFVRIVQHIHANMVLLQGQRHALSYTKAWIAKVIKIMACVMITAIMIGFMLGEVTIVFIGILCMCLVPLMAVKDLKKQLVKRRRLIQLELPKVINQFLLFVHAGESVQSALVRCANRGEATSPFAMELRRATVRLQNNQSFFQTLEELNRNCGVQEVSFFIQTLFMNYRQGGEQLSASLRMLSNQLWSERKALVKTIGEEASSKLVFPMILTFLAIMIVVGAPAVILMNF